MIVPGKCNEIGAGGCFLDGRHDRRFGTLFGLLKRSRRVNTGCVTDRHGPRRNIQLRERSRIRTPITCSDGPNI